MSLPEQLDKIKNAFLKLEEVGFSFDRDFIYALERSQEMFKTFSEFKIGDRVKLKCTPVITEKESPGWMCSKHFLKKGKRGIIREVDFYNGKFSASVLLDKQTWKDSDGKIHPIDHAHLYTFSQSMLEPVNPTAEE